MKRIVSVLAVAWLLPSLAFADTVAGGFPAHSLWLSKTSVTEGDSVQIFAPIYNAGNEKMQGDVAFMVDDAAIGSVHFSLGQGESQIASLAWSAKQGAHTITAHIQNAAGASGSVLLSKDATDAIQISVAAAPPPPALQQAAASAANLIQSAVSAALPTVSAAAGAVLGETESLRTAAKTALETSLSTDGGTQSAATPAGQVLGAETENLAAALSGSAHTNFSPLRLLKQIALIIVSYEWIFYPLLLLALLFALYLLAKQLARPRPMHA